MESITKTIFLDGEKIEFARLDLSDLFSLADEVQAEREAAARDLCRTDGLDKYETLNVLMELRTRKPTVQEILMTASSPQGSHRILTKSLTKQKVDAAKQKDIVSKLNVADCLDTARMLVLDVQEVKPKVEEKESPLPESPSTSGESVKSETAKPDDGLGYYGKK